MTFAGLLVYPLMFSLALPASAADTLPRDTLARTRAQVESFLKLFSEVRCTEVVVQAKLTKHGKVDHQEKSTYDYLVLAQESGSYLNLQESRLEQQAPQKKANVPLLVTNGFATLLLVFHPFYKDSFEFSPPETEVVNGQTLARIAFRHIRNKPTTMELVLRGREYPLDITGSAWIDPASGSIVRIESELAQTMDDIGLRVLRTDVQYDPVHLRGVDDSLRLPSIATVEVQTARQHWRNIHRFSGYQHFSVDVEETVKAQK
ncbi:MAG: hypothetical protein LAO06_04445 [Acidobacteriia bacterium]|nr:hypothetical protein [Terriglobia bacterium]